MNHDQATVDLKKLLTYNANNASLTFVEWAVNDSDIRVHVYAKFRDVRGDHLNFLGVVTKNQAANLKYLFPKGNQIS